MTDQKPTPDTDPVQVQNDTPAQPSMRMNGTPIGPEFKPGRLAAWLWLKHRQTTPDEPPPAEKARMEAVINWLCFLAKSIREGAIK